MEYKVSNLVNLIEEHYRKPDNEVGGVLHIVTDDENLAKNHIVWVLNKAKDLNDTLAITIAEELLELDIKARRKVVREFQKQHKY